MYLLPGKPLAHPSTLTPLTCHPFGVKDVADVGGNPGEGT